MADLRPVIATFPQTPGVYQFFDGDGNILYIGKAKRLRARVSSYFRSLRDLEPSKRAMVLKARRVEYIVTTSEIEALLLESNLIKQHRPPYNILLRDDKQYKWIKITWDDVYPKIISVRSVAKDGGQYFGPFTDGTAVTQTLTYLKKIFRYCDQAEKNPARKPCFDYYIKRCFGACIGKTTPDHYRNVIRDAAQFLAGHTDSVMKDLELRMHDAASKKRFELAAQVRDQIRDLRHVLQKQRAIFPRAVDWDVVGLILRGQTAVATLLHLRKGKLLGRETFFVDLHGEKEESTVMSRLLVALYAERKTDLPRSIVLSVRPDDSSVSQWMRTLRSSLNFIVPFRGEKKKLVSLALANARDAWQQRSNTLPEATSKRHVLEDLSRLLDLPRPPHRIECFDISHTQGIEQVGSMVVMVDGVEVPAEYRKFKIERTSDTNQSNDVASMREVLTRRLKHLADTFEQDDVWPRPDLIIIDGGKAQVNAASTVLKEMHQHIPIVGLAKRLEEIFIPGRSESLHLPLDAPALSLLRHLRDEAHRFAITFHRSRRGKRGLTSWLDTISGVGPVTRKKLIHHFGSGAAVRKAPLEELIAVVGPSFAQKIFDRQIDDQK